MGNQIEGNGSACGCQILGILPITWHWENFESACVRMKSNPEGRLGNR